MPNFLEIALCFGKVPAILCYGRLGSEAEHKTREILLVAAKRPVESVELFESGGTEVRWRR